MKKRVLRELGLIHSLDASKNVEKPVEKASKNVEKPVEKPSKNVKAKKVKKTKEA